MARHIHWHIATNVWYLALDEKRQEIAWVDVEDRNGEFATEYIDPAKKTETETQRIEKEKRLMDCVDCHNRATHIFHSPAELIDMALIQGKIDKNLPFIKREGLNALDPTNPSLEQAFVKVEAIKDFYRASYPQIYQEKEAAIDKALKELREVARLTTFPEMKITWKTYADHLGHGESPGCLRCPGKLVAITGGQQGKTIDVNCDSCHYFELK